MIDKKQSDRTLSEVARTRTAAADKEALDYWIRRAEWLNTAKPRSLTDHFRRDVTAGP